MTQQPTILLIAETPPVCTNLAERLTQDRYDVIEASPGNGCLHLAREIGPDIVLLNATPGDADSLALCQALKSDSCTPPPLCALLYDEYPDTAEIAVAEHDGIVDTWFVRPFADQDLLARLRLLLRVQSAECTCAALRYDMGERVKELRCLYHVTNILREEPNLATMFQHVVDALPAGWQYPEVTCARIRYTGAEYCTTPFVATPWRLASDIVIDGEQWGAVEVFYTEERPEFDEGPFLQQERDMINAIAQHLEETIEHHYDVRALRQSEERFRTYFNASLIGMAFTSLEKGWLEVNDQLCAILGYPRDELIALTWAELTYPDDLEADVHEFERLTKGEIDGCTLNKRFIRKDGAIVYATIWARAVRTPDGAIDYFVAQVQDITERIYADLEYRSVLQTTPDGFWIVDADNGRFLEVNDAYCRMIGYSRAELLTMGILDAVEQPEETAVHIAKVVAQGFDRFETRHRRKDGRIIIVEISARYVASYGGRFMVFVRDITEHSLWEAALRESEERFRTYFHESLMGMAITSPEKGWIEVNEQLCRSLGYTRDELRATTWADLTYPDDLEADVRQFERMVEGEINGYKLDKRLVRKDGSVIHTIFSVRATRHPDGALKYVLAQLQDITGRIHAELEYQSILQTTSDGFCVADASDGRLIEANGAFCRMSGYHRDEILQMRIPDIAVDKTPEAILQQIADVLEYGSRRFESSLRHKDGQIIAIDVSAQYVASRDGILTIFVRDITDRKRAEQDLRESEARYRTLLNAIPDRVFRHDSSGAFVDYHAPRDATLVAPPEAFLGKHYRDVMPPAITEPFDAAIESARNTGNIARFEYDLPMDGKIHSYEARVVAGGDGDIVSIVRDITDRKRAEQALHEQHEQFLTIFDAFPEFLYVVDPATDEVLFVNKVFGNMLKRNPVGGKCYREFQHFNARCDFCTNETILRTRQPYTWEHHNPILNVDLLITDQIIRWPDGRDVRFELAIDITARKQAERDLRQSQQMLKLVIETIPTFVFWKDRNSVYLGSNQNFARLVGLAGPDDVIGKNDFELPYYSEQIEEFRANDRRIMEEGQTEQGLIESAQLPDGREIWVEISKAPLRDVDGTVIGVLGIFNDITDRKYSEDERERLTKELARKNDELEQVVYVASHDLRSPLVNVQGFSKELQASLSDLAAELDSAPIPDEIRARLAFTLEDDIPESLNYILTSTEKMDTLLRGLLRLSRLGRAALSIEPLDMDRLIAETISAFDFQIKQAGVQITVAPLPRCMGDATQIGQLFANLISNALKYPDPARPGVVAISGHTADVMAVYCVEDNGLGIAPEHQSKIFELYHRLNPDQTEGEGLGLTIVRTILDRHSGWIWVESEPGEGSRFFVSLPEVLWNVKGTLPK